MASVKPIGAYPHTDLSSLHPSPVDVASSGGSDQMTGNPSDPITRRREVRMLAPDAQCIVFV